LTLVGVVLVTLIYVDMVPVNKKYLNEDNFVKESEFYRVFQPTQADQAIKQDRNPNYRVLNLTRDPWNDAFTSYHHKSIGGYHAAKLRRYNDLIKVHLEPETKSIIAELSSGKQEALQNVKTVLESSPALRMLNCKYVIYNGAAPPIVNGARLGHGWFVREYEVVERPDDALYGLGKISVGTKCLIEKADAAPVNGLTLNYDAQAYLNLKEFKPNYLAYETGVTNGSEQLAVFPEVYYGKGWQAYVDGQPVEHFRVNYVLRGMRIPAGTHKIEFKFEPASYYTGETMALIFSLIVLAGVGGGVHGLQNEGA
ncbi:MAG: YfhO family protein, partial [Bacteroidota bacterium]